MTQNDRPERERVEVTQADREALSQDILLSIPTYMHQSIFRAFARHRIAALRPADGLVEPVAVIGKDWSLLWASPDSLADIVKRTGIAIGTPLYAATALRSQEARNAE